jgi:hypothetical protein
MMAEAEDPAHVRVRDPSREQDLAFEPLDRFRVRGDLGTDGLEGDLDLEVDILGLVDLAHSAQCDEASDPVALGEDVAPGEAPRSRLEAAARRVVDRGCHSR